MHTGRKKKNMRCHCQAGQPKGARVLEPCRGGGEFGSWGEQNGALGLLRASSGSSSAEQRLGSWFSACGFSLWLRWRKMGVV